MTLAAADFGFVKDLVYKKAAIVLESGKEYLVDVRLSGLARQEGLPSVAELIGKARQDPYGLQVKVVEAMTTNETLFFRDVHPFDALRHEILPQLITARANVRSLTFWSAACSTGQEPYSVAMLLQEHFPQLASWRIRIIGTDLSRGALEQAKEGTYKQLEVNRGLPASHLVKYFDRQGPHWQIKSDIRRLVEFRQMNLIEPWGEFGRPDVVFLRNVLIYFNVDTKKTLLRRVRQVLGPMGALFLGGAETTLGLSDDFERRTHGKAVYYAPKA